MEGRTTEDLFQYRVIEHEMDILLKTFFLNGVFEFEPTALTRK